MFFNIKGIEEEVSFHVFEKDDPKLPRKRKFLNYYEEEEAPVEFVSNVKEYYLHFFIKQLK